MFKLILALEATMDNLVVGNLVVTTKVLSTAGLKH